jgi:pimeloyl-ACP methyl ester carboxylesterase
MFFRTSDKKAAEKFETAGVKASIVYQQIGKYSMHYVKSGKDSFPTLFFIHGSPGSWDAFESYLRDSALLQRFRLISVDRPGFGYSNFGDALNLDEQSSLISKVLKSVNNGKPVYLVGHSLGGPLCIRLAIDNPGSFAGMVLLAAAIDPGLEKPEKWRLLFMNTPLQYLVPGAMRPSNYELWYLKTDLVKLKHEIPGASLPFCWMVHGDHDMMVSYKNVDFALANLDSSRLSVITITGANHFIPWSHFDIIKELLMKLPLH